MGILSDGGTFDPVCRSSMAHRKTQEGGASSNRQTSPRIKGCHLKENCCHRDGGLLFMRHIAFFRGICGK